MEKNSKIYVAGHRGLVGSAIVRQLEKQGYTNILTATHDELDLMDQVKVDEFFNKNRPDYVFDAAAKVGGIIANNTSPADFLFENMQIELNVIGSAHKYKVKKLLFLGTSCIYPKLAPQPLKEEYLLTGPLEYTNEGYAIAKISGIMMCKKYREQYGDNFISAMPTNIYGINDNFHPKNSHVLQGIMRRLHEAKVNNSPEMVIWGTGKPKREYLYADDLADALIFLMDNYEGLEHVNVGTGVDMPISELAETINKVVGFKGKLVYDTTKPDGTPRKLMDVTKINSLGWKATTPLEEGITKTYEWFLNEGLKKYS